MRNKENNRTLLSLYNTFFVDIDDTLYLEENFVLSGLQAVSRVFDSLGADSAEVSKWLHNEFKAHGRRDIFNNCLRKFKIDPCIDLITYLVDIYRQHVPDIWLDRGVEAGLDHLASIGSIVFVTDGLPSVQRLKVKSLKLDHWATDVIYTWEFNMPKPQIARYIEHNFIHRVKTSPVVIGDNPYADMALARDLDIDSIRIFQGRFRGAPSGSPAPN